MRALPLDPLSIIALALLCGHIALVWRRRVLQRPHLHWLLRSVADVGANTRGDR